VTIWPARTRPASSTSLTGLEHAEFTVAHGDTLEVELGEGLAMWIVEQEDLPG
jgi:hypothetical protein